MVTELGRHRTLQNGMNAAGLAVLSVALVGSAWHFGAWRGSAARFELQPSVALRKVASEPLFAGLIADPLLPSRPARRAERAAPLASEWMWERPAREYQYSRSVAERDGENACNTPDPGFGSYAHWRKLSEFGQVLVPLEHRAEQFDVLIHFHGHEPARKELVRSAAVSDARSGVGKLVLVGVTLDSGGDYMRRFAEGPALGRLLEQVEAEVSSAWQRPASARRLAVSGWSVGYTAVRQLLAGTSAPRLEAVVLIDGLHAARDKTAMIAELAPFEAYARSATAGDKLMIVTHSSIDPPTFASTTEMSHLLVSRLGGTPERVHREDSLGLELIETYSRGNFHVRGFAGNDKPDHCAQFRAFGEILPALATHLHR